MGLLVVLAYHRLRDVSALVELVGVERRRAFRALQRQFELAVVHSPALHSLVLREHEDLLRLLLLSAVYRDCRLELLAASA